MTKPINIDRLIATLAQIAGVQAGVATKAAPSLASELSKCVELEFDQEPIVSTLPLHKERFRAIVEQFTSTLDERFDAIESALGVGDARALAELSHSLKGASGNCGFSPLAEVASLLEQAARSSELETIPAALVQLRHIQSRIVTPKATDAFHCS